MNLSVEESVSQEQNQQQVCRQGAGVASADVSNARNSTSLYASIAQPNIEHLLAALDAAARSLADLGVSEQELLDALPQARAEYLAATYRPEFLQDLEREWQTLHPEAASE